MFRRIFSNTLTVIIAVWFIVVGAVVVANPAGAKHVFFSAFQCVAGQSAGNAAPDGKVSGSEHALSGLVEFVQNNSPGQWFVFVSAIAAGFLLGRVVAAVLAMAGRRLKERGWNARSHLFADLASPAWLAIFTIGINVGLAAMETNDATDIATNTFQKLLYSLAAFWYAFNLVGVVEVGLSRLGDATKMQVDSQLIVPIRKTLRIVVVVIAVLFIVGAVFQYDVRAWLAGLGIAGLAVSLAAQDSLKNLFGSITILIDRPFRVGERIIYGGHDGVIEEIGFRSTTVRTGSGHLVSIPNASIVNGSVENVGRRPFIKRSINVTITCDTPKAKIEEAVQIIKNILEEDGIREPIHLSVGENDYPPRVYFNDLNADSLNINVIYWFIPPAYWDYMEHAQRLNLRIFEEYERAGIEFAFPTQTLYLAGDDKRRLTVEMLGRDLG